MPKNKGSPREIAVKNREKYLGQKALRRLDSQWAGKPGGWESGKLKINRVSQPPSFPA
jgi:hypothetical protein